MDSVLDNDHDLEDVTLIAHLISAPAKGNIVLSSDGTFTYTNTDELADSDSFEYEACDSYGACTAATVAITIDHSAPTVTCVLPTQVVEVGDTVDLDLSLLFAPPAGESLTFGATNAPQSLSIVGSLLSGILQASDVPGSPYASVLKATTAPGGVSATENVVFQVLPAGEIVFRSGFDIGGSSQVCQ